MVNMDVELQLIRYKNILSNMGITGKDMSHRLGLDYGSYRRATMNSAKVLPRWVISFLYVHDEFSEKKSTATQ
jgi:hypothetical protein